MKIGIAQINTTLGDFAGNAVLIASAYKELVEKGADLVITPELALTGYPPQDLLFRGNFVQENLDHLEALEQQIGNIPLLVGFVDHHADKGKPFYNAAALLLKGSARLVAHKRLLPTYDVFEEARYFEPGSQSLCFSYQGRKWGVTICEDLWTSPYLPRALYSIDPVAELIDQGAQIILNLSASPFGMGKEAQRIAMLQSQAKRFHVPIVYCNSVGGNDQLVFDGGSLVLDADGRLIGTCRRFEEDNRVIDLSQSTQGCTDPSSDLAILKPQILEDPMDELYNALVLGIRDYLRKCGFERALLGLSGGIDSAVVAALAVAALGPENVTGVLMSGPYSSPGSITDAIALARNLAIPTRTIPITSLYEEAKKTLYQALDFSGNSTIDLPPIDKSISPEPLPLSHEHQPSPSTWGTEVTPSVLSVLEGHKHSDVTHENLQARLRGLLLMALSNKHGSLLLTTGNKSELAIGYCTLYGDMCGGLAVIADVPKTVIYQLARFINRHQEIIPWNSINKAPSAELRPNQTDQDSLPPYEILDEVLRLLVEEHQSISHIIARGFEEKTVHWIARHLYRNEYKRQQSAPGLKVTGKAFGLGRHFPIAHRYLER